MSDTNIQSLASRPNPALIFLCAKDEDLCSLCSSAARRTSPRDPLPAGNLPLRKTPSCSHTLGLGRERVLFGHRAHTRRDPCTVRRVQGGPGTRSGNVPSGLPVIEGAEDTLKGVPSLRGNRSLLFFSLTNHRDESHSAQLHDIEFTLPLSSYGQNLRVDCASKRDNEPSALFKLPD